MAIVNLDTGILLSSAGVITTIVLFILKTYSSKTEKAVSQAEVVKSHESSITHMRTQVGEIDKELDSIKSNVANNRGRIDNIAEAVTSLIRTNEGVSTRVNVHESDIVGLKKDIEYLKVETKKQQRGIDENSAKLDRLYDKVHNEHDRPYSAPQQPARTRNINYSRASQSDTQQRRNSSIRQEKRQGETSMQDGYDPHEQREDYEDSDGT